MGFWDKRKTDPSSDATAPGRVDHGEEHAAERWVDLGLEFEAQSRLDEALKHYQTAIALQPEFARAHFLSGNILLDRGEAAAALAAYTAVLRYKPDSAGAHCNKGNAYLQLSDPLNAAAAYRRALELRPDLPDALAGLHAAQELASERADAFFREGLDAQEAERLLDAAEAYRQALAFRPDHTDALNNLGGILLSEDRAEEAVVLLQRASEHAPGNAAIWMNLGDALGLQRNWTAAVSCYERALQLVPGNVAAFVRLGYCLLGWRRPEDAAASFQKALRIDPDNLDASLGLTDILIDMNQLDPAQAHCSRILARDANNAKANNLQGVIHKKRRRTGDAILLFRRALVEQPELLEAHINLGSALQDIAEFDAAIACYEQALSLDYESAAAHCGLGTVFQRRGDHVAAERAYTRALALDDGLVVAHNNLGLIYTHSREFARAAHCFERALTLDPRFAAGHANQASMLKDLGKLEESLETLRRALEIDNTCMIAHNNLLFIQNYLAEQPGQVLLADARRFGEIASGVADPYTSWTNSPDPQRPLRVGLVSGDLGNHPVGYFLEGVLSAFASQPPHQLQFHAYSNRLNEDGVSQRLRSCCAHWCVSTGMSDELLAQRIRDDGIDILIDLAGHTANNRLTVFGWKAAPVQVSWLGYFATTGLPAMDYFLADPWTLPPAQEPFFTEQVWRLPETRLCFTPPRAEVRVNALPALSQGHVTFGCFNTLSKMNDAVVQLWARVLQAVPGSRLFLKCSQLADEGVRQRTCERFAAHGIKAERLLLEGHSERADYLAAYQRVDIALDPFPFPGGTTTVEALWMGVPVLTLQGERFLARQGVGLLMNAGLADWVAADADAYVARAVEHTKDLQALAALRARLRQQVLTSPVYDARRFARHLEEALRTMWISWCQRSGADMTTQMD